MAIIYITPDTSVDHGMRLHDPQVPGRTSINLVTIKSARKVLGLAETIAVKAIYSETSATYAFMYNGRPYRALFPMVLQGAERIEHFSSCKSCRDGVWCGEGQRIIQAAGVMA